ncbi:MAG: hypothetical protein WDN28_21640 [Chthoniobacter sp.]
MSLKAFHILFIALATVLAAGCAWWAFASSASATFGAASAVTAVALFIYGIYFVKKSRRLIL